MPLFSHPTQAYLAAVDSENLSAASRRRPSGTCGRFRPFSPGTEVPGYTTWSLRDIRADRVVEDPPIVMTASAARRQHCNFALIQEN